MKEAIPASAIVIVTILLNPEKITGNARGNFILKRVCHFVLPIPFEASNIAGETFTSPIYVFRTIGSIAYIISAVIAVLFPIPEKGIRNPSRAIDGIVYRKFTADKTIFEV